MAKIISTIHVIIPKKVLLAATIVLMAIITTTALLMIRLMSTFAAQRLFRSGLISRPRLRSDLEEPYHTDVPNGTKGYEIPQYSIPNNGQN